MAVYHRSDSLKKLHEKQKHEQTLKDEISEIQDALMEIAEIVNAMPLAANEATVKDGENNG